MQNNTDGGPTREGVKRCAEWLAKCLELGWSRDELDFLEALWWQYHDHRGNLLSADSRPQPAEPLSPREAWEAHRATWGDSK